MKISVTKVFSFDAAHQLVGIFHGEVVKPNTYYGLCGTGRHYETLGEMVHGHTYKLEVTVTGDIKDLKEDGMLINFSELKEIVNNAVIDVFDHTNLNKSFISMFNKTPELNDIMYITTAEVMAVSIKSNISNLIKIKNKNLDCTKIVLWETATSCATIED